MCVRMNGCFFVYRCPVCSDYGLLCGLCATRHLVFCSQNHCVSLELMSDRFVKCDRCRVEGRRVKIQCAFGAHYKRCLCAACTGREVYPSCLLSSEPAEGTSVAAAVRFAIAYNYEHYSENPGKFIADLTEEICDLFRAIEQKRGAAVLQVSRSGLNSSRIHLAIQRVDEFELMTTLYFHRDPMKPALSPTRLMYDFLLLHQKGGDALHEQLLLLKGPPPEGEEHPNHYLKYLRGPASVLEILVVKKGEFDVPPPKEAEMSAEPTNFVSGTTKWVQLLEPPEPVVEKGKAKKKK